LDQYPIEQEAKSIPCILQLGMQLECIFVDEQRRIRLDLVVCRIERESGRRLLPRVRLILDVVGPDVGLPAEPGVV
jgi:hypothetical protein